jgi:uncharacterized membrane protein YkoI
MDWLRERTLRIHVRFSFGPYTSCTNFTAEETRMKAASILTAGAIVLASIASTGAGAMDDDMAKMQAVAKGRGFITPEQAIERALAAKPGTAVEADLDRRLNGDYYYEVEIVDAEGIEWEIKLDARTGDARKADREWDWD